MYICIFLVYYKKKNLLWKLHMKTYIVAFDDINAINNFKHVPCRFIKDDIEVVIHLNPIAEISASEYILNYDLLISSHHFTETAKICSNGIPYPENNRVFLQRYSKIEQAVGLKQIAKKLSLSNFYTLDIWVTANDSNWAFNNAPTKCFIIKCNDGARGIGQILVKDNIPLSELLNAINDCEMTTEKLLQQFPSIIYNTEGENYANEGLNMLRQQGFHAVEYIPNIVSEYRFTIINNNLCYPVKRFVKTTSDYKQVTGAPAVRDSTISEFGNVNELKPFMEEINAVISQLNIKFGSCDIFVMDDGRWGLFEFCNQFGTSAYDPEDMIEIHQDFIISQIKKLCK